MFSCRAYKYFLFGKEIVLLGMNCPANWSDEKETRAQYFKQLYQQGIRVIIGVHEGKEFITECQIQQIQYHFYPLPDGVENEEEVPVSPVNPLFYENIYRLIKSAIVSFSEKSVAIHCGTGEGRTGTLLACLKLYEYFQKPLLEPLERSEYLIPIFYPSKMMKCSRMIQKAILFLRKEAYAAIPEISGSRSVETETDLTTLRIFENFLMQKFKRLREFEAQLDGMERSIKNEILFYLDGLTKNYALKEILELPSVSFSAALKSLLMTQLLYFYSPKNFVEFNCMLERLFSDEVSRVKYEPFILTHLQSVNYTLYSEINAIKSYALEAAKKAFDQVMFQHGFFTCALESTEHLHPRLPLIDCV